MVGLIPLFAVHVITPETYRKLDNFRRRTEWFLDRESAPRASRSPGASTAATCSRAVPPARLERVLGAPLRRVEVPLAVRPALALEGARERAGRCSSRAIGASRSATSRARAMTRMKGGNSNWRGPVWFPTGYMLYRSLLRLDHGFGDALMIPAVSGHAPRTLREGADELAARMVGDLRARPGRPAAGRTARSSCSRAIRTSATSCSSTSTSTARRARGSAPRTRPGGRRLVAEMVLRRARARRPTPRPRAPSRTLRADPCYEGALVSLLVGIAILAFAVSRRRARCALARARARAMPAIRTFAVVAAVSIALLAPAARGDRRGRLSALHRDGDRRVRARGARAGDPVARASTPTTRRPPRSRWATRR